LKEARAISLNYVSAPNLKTVKDLKLERNESLRKLNDKSAVEAYKGFRTDEQRINAREDGRREYFF